MKLMVAAVALIVLACGVVYASLPDTTCRSVDYKCFSDCLAKGYSYGFCQRLCSY